MRRNSHKHKHHRNSTDIGCYTSRNEDEGPQKRKRNETKQKSLPHTNTHTHTREHSHNILINLTRFTTINKPAIVITSITNTDMTGSKRKCNLPSLNNTDINFFASEANL